MSKDMLALLWRILLFLSALWIVQRTLGFLLGAPRRQSHQQRAPADEPSANKMVRDPVCGMYLDPRLAISLKHKKEILYFCSRDCLQKFTTNST